MQYCSAACQQRDATQHNTLCSTFQNFQQRPTPNHYRSIYFPVNKNQPRFIWLLFDGDRGYHNFNDADLAQYVFGSRYGGITVTDHHGITLPRELKNMLIRQHDQNMYANNQPHNQSLHTMMGTLAARWRGGYVGHALKYTYADEDFEKADEGLPGDGFPLIALDLDTTASGPSIAWLVWYTNGGGQGF
jgi:hypothetical protein